MVRQILFGQRAISLQIGKLEFRKGKRLESTRFAMERKRGLVSVMIGLLNNFKESIK
jgi:hypothetical protein